VSEPGVKLSLLEKVALRVAFLAGAVVSISLGMRVDVTDLVARGGACEDVQMRRRSLARRLRDEVVRPKDIATAYDQFKGEYAVGTYAMAGYALTNIAFDAPETRDESRELLSLIVDRMCSPEITAFDTNLWRQAALTDLASDRGHAAYLGHLNLLLGCRKLLGGDGRHDALHAEISDAIARRILARRSRHFESYPGEVYTMDNLVAAASLVVADHVLGPVPDRSRAVREQLAYARAHLIDPKTGLLVFALDPGTGEPRQRGRGSAAGWASFFLPMVDKAFAHEQVLAERAHLVGRLGVFAGVREYARDDPEAGYGDIDSGPVVVWGVSATGFSIAGARREGDAALLSGFLSLAEAFGVSVDQGNERRYLASPLLGDAILLAMKTSRPWWDGMGESGGGK
jgi:hypothetical protein